MEKLREGAIKLSIADLNTVLSWGWDGRKLLDEIIKLDYELIPGMDARDEGTAEQWTDVFMKWPQTWRLLVSGASTIVGYWHFVTLKKEYFETAMQGRLLDSQITEDKVAPMEKPGDYDVYWVMTGVVSRLQHTTAYDVLYGSFLRVAEDLADRGIFIRSICDAGAAVSERFGRRVVAKHVSKGDVYMGKFYPFPEQMMIFGKHPKLIRLYSDHFSRGLGSLLKK